MPVRKVGKDCYQWGNQKVYCGNGAKEKAIKQGIAIENTGWMEAEEIDIGTSQWGFVLPPSFDEVNGKFYLHEGHLLISTDEEGKWRVWVIDGEDFSGWNIVDSPLFSSYQKNYPLTRPHFYQFDTVDDAITHAEWVHEDQIKDVKEWLEMPNLHDYTALGLVSKGKRAALRGKMTKEDKEMARHPNRSQSWLPSWIRKELSEELKVKMVCPTCGEKVFHSLLAAERHHFYCRNFGTQPINNLYMTPFEMFLCRLIVSKRQKKEAEQTNKSWLIIPLAIVGLSLSIPYFLDSRGNKV